MAATASSFRKQLLSQIKPVALLIVLLLALHFLLRLVFYAYNAGQFGSMTGAGLSGILYYGLQQDLSAILLLNIPAILLVWICTYAGAGWQRFALLIMLLLNMAGIFLNLFDAGYYRFVRHRTTVEVLSVASDSLSSAYTAVADHWGILLAFLAVVILLVIGLKRIKFPSSAKAEWVASNSARLVILIVLVVLMRGWSARPINPYTPLLSVSPAKLPLAQNSVINLAYSFVRTQSSLPAFSYMPDSVAARLLPVSQSYHNEGKWQKKNVVIFILESFSGCYLMPGHPMKAKTPFLDSLRQEGLYFPRAFAHNQSSVHGIVPILAAIPSLLDEPLYQSAYANLDLQGIGNTLKPHGYQTSFFMGAGKDHFGFGKFTSMVGIDRYYSSKDHHGENAYDGSWGLFDGPFLDVFQTKLRKETQPFVSVFFNISSHYPFTIPASHKQLVDSRYPPAQQAIQYVDMVLADFFKEAKNGEWFRNTLFVFCADHWFEPAAGAEHNQANNGSISLFFYDPSQPWRSTSNAVASQSDVIPTVLDMLHYSGPYKGFGSSLLDTAKKKYVVNKYRDHFYQCISDSYITGYDPLAGKTNYMYAYRGDSIVSENLVSHAELKATRDSMETYTKAFLQQYHRVLTRRSF